MMIYVADDFEGHHWSLNARDERQQEARHDASDYMLGIF